MWHPELTSWNNGLNSYKSDLQTVGCLPELVTIENGLVSRLVAIYCGSEFSFLKYLSIVHLHILSFT